MIRPFYRWKSFWFGLLTLAFMGWAAMDSREYLTCANFSPWHVERLHEVTFFAYRRPIPGQNPPVFVRDFWGGFSSRERHFPSVTSGDGFWILNVPDATIFFPFLLAWIGWLAYRLRRLRAALKANQEEASS